MRVSGRDLARPAMVGIRTAHRGVWAFRRFSLDRAFTAIAVLPTFVVMLCIFGIPLLFSLYLSFTGWALDQALLGGHFVGLANYEDLLTDPAFVGSLGITFGYTAATVAAQMVLGLVAAPQHRLTVYAHSAHRAGGADDDHTHRRGTVLEAFAGT